MNFEEAGSALRAEREKRSLSVEDVAHQLKISPRQIRALESGDIDSLPHPAYAKGFIRSYASWLGLTPNDLQGRGNEPGDSEFLDMEKGKPAKSGSKVWFWFIILLLLIAAGIYYAWSRDFWGFFEKQSADESSPISSTLPKADEYLAGKKEREPQKTFEKPVVDSPVAAPVDLPQAVVTPPTPPVDKPAEKVEEKVPTNIEPTASAEAENAVVKIDEPTIPADNHKLIITAIEECWVHSNSDKTDTRQFSLRKGDTFALTFTDTLELKLGNAGGVRLRYDGRDLPAPGTSGQVKTITFPPVEQ